MNPPKWVACVWVVLIFGCAGLKTGEKMTLFDDTARAYLRTIRWGDYESANAFKKMQSPGNKTTDFENLRQIRVTDYHILKTILAEDKSSILRIVNFQYYRVTEAKVKNLIDRQSWEYDEEANRWFLMSGLPDFK